MQRMFPAIHKDLFQKLHMVVSLPLLGWNGDTWPPHGESLGTVVSHLGVHVPKSVWGF